MRKKAPQIIVIVLVIALAVYISFEFLEDVLLERQPLASEPIISAIINFTKDVTATISSWGYAGVFGLMVLESSSLPVPSEVVLPFAGYLVSMGLLNFWLVVIVATVAAIVGSLIDYYIGLKGIEILAKKRILGHVILSMDQLAMAGKWFEKYGSFAIFIARLIPGLRTIISFPAGAARMPLVKFLVYTIAGCLLWNVVLIYVGYYLGINWTEVADISHYIIIAVIVGFAAIVITYFVLRNRQRKARVAAKESTQVA